MKSCAITKLPASYPMLLKDIKSRTLCELCLPNGIAKHPFHRGNSSVAGGE